jgi:GT2 family glycosyltransferase
MQTNNQIKYSIILPYYKRPELESSLISFLHHYSNRFDYEVIIIEDLVNSEDQNSHSKLIEIFNKFKSKINIHVCLDTLRSFNSANKYNIGFLNSSGKFIILSNPETIHEVDVLSGLDNEFNDNQNNYIICSCKSLFLINSIINNFDEMKNNKFNMWYQHTQHRNMQYHFCSAISRSNFIKVGGFDERYCNGIAYEDDSFKERVKRNGINFINRDDLITIHIEHDRSYTSGRTNLIDVNKNLFEHQKSTNDFFAPNKINSIKPKTAKLESNINQLSSYVDQGFEHLAPSF